MERKQGAEQTNPLEFLGRKAAATGIGLDDLEKTLRQEAPERAGQIAQGFLAHHLDTGRNLEIYQLIQKKEWLKQMLPDREGMERQALKGLVAEKPKKSSYESSETSKLLLDLVRAGYPHMAEVAKAAEANNPSTAAWIYYSTGMQEEVIRLATELLDQGRNKDFRDTVRIGGLHPPRDPTILKAVGILLERTGIGEEDYSFALYSLDNMLSMATTKQRELDDETRTAIIAGIRKVVDATLGPMPQITMEAARRLGDHGRRDAQLEKRRAYRKIAESLAEENPGMAAEAAEKIIFKQDEKAQKDDLYRRIAKGAIRKGHMTTAVLLLAEYTDFAPPEERVALMEEAITAGMEKEPYQAFRLATEHMATTNPGLRARALTAWIEKDSARNPNLILDDLEEPEEMTQLARHLYRNGLYLPARKAFVRAGYTGPESAECAKMLLTRGEIGDTEQKSLKITDEEYIAAAEGLAATNPYTAYLYLVDCRDNPKAKDALRNISEPLLLARRKDEAYFAQICSGNPIPETINKVRTILISERGARAIDTFEHHGDMEGIAMAYDTLCDQLSTGEKYRIAMKLSTRTEDKRWDATAQDLRSALVSTYVAGAIMLFRDYRDQKGLDLAAAELKRQVPALEGIEDLMRKTLLLTVPESTQKP